jgi:L-lactate permease
MGFIVMATIVIVALLLSRISELERKVEILEESFWVRDIREEENYYG